MSFKTFFMFVIAVVAIGAYVHTHYPDQAYILIVGVVSCVLIGVIVNTIFSVHSRKDINTKFDKTYSNVPSHVITDENSNSASTIYKITELEVALHEDLVEASKGIKKNKLDL